MIWIPKKTSLVRRATLITEFTSPGLVGFAIGLVNSVINVARRTSEVFLGIQIIEEL